MQKTIVVDPKKCTGCRECEVSCSVKNEGLVNPYRARISVVDFEEILLQVPMLCQQCVDAPCGAICPVKAISRSEEDGIAKVDYNTCIGCKMCVTACPFGAMKFDPVGKKVFKCEQCGGDPTCIKYCDPKAITYVDSDSLTNVKVREAAKKLGDMVEKVGRFPLLTK
jgi:Fe-S-cluster-containing hydrogenase component 2